MAKRITNSSAVEGEAVQKLSKKDAERIRNEKLKMAAYCPRVSGASWDYTPNRKKQFGELAEWLKAAVC